MKRRSQNTVSNCIRRFVADSIAFNNIPLAFNQLRGIHQRSISTSKPAPHRTYNPIDRIPRNYRSHHQRNPTAFQPIKKERSKNENKEILHCNSELKGVDNNMMSTRVLNEILFEGECMVTPKKDLLDCTIKLKELLM